MISIWPWSRINELTTEVLRQWGIACKVREERDSFQMVAKTWEANSDADNRSRRGWQWLYEQKCEQWEFLEREIRWVDDLYDNTFQRLTEERGLRDGWEQTARENEAEIVDLMGQVRQSDGNTQRVEAERDEALQAVDHLREDRDRLQRRVDLQHAAIERLEVGLKDAQRNDQRDSRGRFTSR